MTTLKVTLALDEMKWELAKLKAELAANRDAHANFEQDIEHLTA